MSSLLSWIAGGLIALQSPAPLPEVRQLVSFRFLPGRTAEAIELFRAEALPLYLLLSDGFGFFRVLGISALGDWHRYLLDLRAQPFGQELDLRIAESRQVILAPVPELSVR